MWALVTWGWGGTQQVTDRNSHREKYITYFPSCKMLGSYNAHPTLCVKQSPFEVTVSSVLMTFPEAGGDRHPCFTVEQMKL